MILFPAAVTIPPFLSLGIFVFMTSPTPFSCAFLVWALQLDLSAPGIFGDARYTHTLAESWVPFAHCRGPELALVVQVWLSCPPSEQTISATTVDLDRIGYNVRAGSGESSLWDDL